MKSRGFAFVVFENEKTVDIVLERHEDHYIHGTWVRQYKSNARLTARELCSKRNSKRSQAASAAAMTPTPILNKVEEEAEVEEEATQETAAAWNREEGTSQAEEAEEAVVTLTNRAELTSTEAAEAVATKEEAEEVVAEEAEVVAAVEVVAVEIEVEEASAAGTTASSRATMEEAAKSPHPMEATREEDSKTPEEAEGTSPKISMEAVLDNSTMLELRVAKEATIEIPNRWYRTSLKARLVERTC